MVRHALVLVTGVEACCHLSILQTVHIVSGALEAPDYHRTRPATSFRCVIFLPIFPSAFLLDGRGWMRRGDARAACSSWLVLPRAASLMFEDSPQPENCTIATPQGEQSSSIRNLTTSQGTSSGMEKCPLAASSIGLEVDAHYGPTNPGRCHGGLRFVVHRWAAPDGRLLARCVPTLFKSRALHIGLLHALRRLRPRLLM